MFLTTQLAKGVSLHIRQTTQFKTVNFSVKWRRPLTTKDAAERTVLSNVLQHSNEKFKTSAAFRSYLDDLFGTVLYFDTTKRGNEHTLLLNVETVNDQYLANSNVLQEVLDLIHTVIFSPNLENDAFVSSIVEREKEMVLERIHSIFDDKARYAQYRLMQILRPNHPASISANGTIETVKAVTPQSLKAAYDSMLQNDTVDIYVVGDIDVEEMTEKLRQVLAFGDRELHEKQLKTEIDTKPEEYTKEQQEMKQGKLHIGFSTPVYFGDPDFPKMQIFNGIFGGYAHSKLFMNVREQLKVMQNGEISDLELTQTKAMLTNQLKEALDSARGQIEIYDQYKDLNEAFTIDTWADRWQQVTKEDVEQMAKQVKQEAIYFLCGKED